MQLGPEKNRNEDADELSTANADHLGAQGSSNDTTQPKNDVCAASETEKVQDALHGSRTMGENQDDASSLAILFTSGFERLFAAFDERFSLDRFKEEQISKLHQELQEYKNDLLARVTRPLIQGMIRLHDDLGRTVAALRGKPPEELTPQRVLAAMEGFGDDIELLLAHHGVGAFRVTGETFDPRRQTALRTVPAVSPEQVGQVAERLRPGFEQGDITVQKERVAVFAAATNHESKPAAPCSDNESEAPAIEKEG